MWLFVVEAVGAVGVDTVVAVVAGACVGFVLFGSVFGGDVQ